MAIEPKFRPSLTAKELSLLEHSIHYYLTGQIDSGGGNVCEILELQKLLKTIQLFNFKIGNSYTQPSYVPTGTSIAKPKVEISDLLTEEEIVRTLTGGKGIDYSSTAAMHTAYKNLRMTESLGAKATLEDQAAAAKWIAYCDLHNLDYETGLEK